VVWSSAAEAPASAALYLRIMQSGKLYEMVQYLASLSPEP